ncbi:DNA polymerase IV [Myxococcota bacterium]|nr:DNA polymerase IV [Myxococcota bacterium]MBU1534033.1 DNA polymerase IV [Myxococcota bacterium]
MERQILHLDMDAFYASVEQSDDPSLKGKPVIIGQGERGVVSAASYEARAFGVKSAIPVLTARKLCPGGIFLKGRMARYSEVSREIMDILQRYSPVVEQASIDEAYMDITGLQGLLGPPQAIARDLKAEILDTTGLNCSIGIAPCKYLAKIVSDWNKPDGLYILTPMDVPDFMMQLPIARMPGVGTKFQEELSSLGVRYAGDVLAHSGAWWEERCGKRGAFLHQHARGIDESPVTPNREAKSTSCENTFEEDVSDRHVLKRWLLAQAERIGAELREMGVEAKTITLKCKFSDFRQITRSHTLGEATCSTNTIYTTATRLLASVKLTKPLRLIGLGASNLSHSHRQLGLFESMAKQEGTLDRALDSLRKKHGKAIVRRGPALED